MRSRRRAVRFRRASRLPAIAGLTRARPQCHPSERAHLLGRDRSRPLAVNIADPVNGRGEGWGSWSCEGSPCGQITDIFAKPTPEHDEAPGRSCDLPGASDVVETGVDPVTPRFSGRSPGISADFCGIARNLLETKHQVDGLSRSGALSSGTLWKILDADKKRTSSAFAVSSAQHPTGSRRAHRLATFPRTCPLAYVPLWAGSTVRSAEQYACRQAAFDQWVG